MPCLGRVRLLRHWAGVMDMTMDGSHIISKTPVDGLYLNGGWCYGGFKATPASGWCFAHLIARDEPDPLTVPFALDRFARGATIDEAGIRPDPQAALTFHAAHHTVPSAASATTANSPMAATRRWSIRRWTRPLEAWIDAVYVRRNPKGPHRERWQHSDGCRLWLIVERDTLSHAITSVTPARAAVAALLKEPAR